MTKEVKIMLGLLLIIAMVITMPRDNEGHIVFDKNEDVKPYIAKYIGEEDHNVEIEVRKIYCTRSGLPFGLKKESIYVIENNIMNHNTSHKIIDLLIRGYVNDKLVGTQEWSISTEANNDIIFTLPTVDKVDSIIIEALPNVNGNLILQKKGI